MEESFKYWQMSIRKRNLRRDFLFALMIVGLFQENEMV